MNYADRLTNKIETCGNPSVLGLDPRIDRMPKAVLELADKHASGAADRLRRSIRTFHELVIDAAADLVPAVKLQLAFYEQYGVAGMQGYVDTLSAARRANLLVIADAKRNDVPATAEAYARAFLMPEAEFGADALTISPYLGVDAMQPFIDLAERHNRGIYILVKTSNPGSGDVQDLRVSGVPVFEKVCGLVTRLGNSLIGTRGIPAVGAVVACTHPSAAIRVRECLPAAPFLVVGYGTQGGIAENAALCFDRNGGGAIVNSSRGATYNFPDPDAGLTELARAVRNNIIAMRDAILISIKQRQPELLLQTAGE
jgi:orotidine-5'-phosphate decarboxylase